MVRSLVGITLIFLATPPTLAGQDSGPGPVSPATSQTYDLTLYSRSGVGEGTFAFTGEAASGAMTSGRIDATLNGTGYSGAWHAYDLGQFAIWVAQGTGDAGNFAAFGYATPQHIVGRASISSANGGIWLLRLLSRNTILFVGEAAAGAGA